MFRKVSAAVILVLNLVVCALAQDRDKGIGVIGDIKEPSSNPVLELKARNKGSDKAFTTICQENCDRSGPTQLPVGTDVAVCFKVTADGYVTLWSRDSKGAIALIYPNKFSHPTKVRAAQVKADTNTCIGETEGFRLTIQPPSGPSEVYLSWTRTEEEALAPEDYLNIGGKSASGSRRASTETMLHYNIINGN